jgi:hypothetical protein
MPIRGEVKTRSGPPTGSSRVPHANSPTHDSSRIRPNDGFLRQRRRADVAERGEY